MLKLADFAVFTIRFFSVKIGISAVFTSRFVLRCKQNLLIALLINDSQVAKFWSSKTRFCISTLQILHFKSSAECRRNTFSLYICICLGGRFPAEWPDWEWDAEGIVQVIHLTAWIKGSTTWSVLPALGSPRNRLMILLTPKMKEAQLQPKVHRLESNDDQCLELRISD